VRERERRERERQRETEREREREKEKQTSLMKPNAIDNNDWAKAKSISALALLGLVGTSTIIRPRQTGPGSMGRSNQNSKSMMKIAENHLLI
jgi:hypothetical protein